MNKKHTVFQLITCYKYVKNETEKIMKISPTLAKKRFKVASNEKGAIKLSVNKSFW